MKMKDRVIGLPAKYVQGPGALKRIGAETAGLDKRALIIMDSFVQTLVGDTVVKSLSEEEVTFTLAEFNGECCRPEIDRLAELSRANDCKVVVAIGGGKVLDTGKAVAFESACKFLSAPTIASTDGPVSSIAVEYTEDHVHIGVMRMNQSPNVVLVDSEVISRAPIRLLVAGMGDALATWVEARACHANGNTNFRGGSISDVAMGLARSCHETILEFGRDAVKALERSELNGAVERVIEANVFLSGVGFENTGVAGAHGLDTAISRYSCDHSYQHGERVALGVLFQLHLEARGSELADLIGFYKDVGLPTRLADIGMSELSEDELRKLAELILRDGSPIRNIPIALDEERVKAALVKIS